MRTLLLLSLSVLSLSSTAFAQSSSPDSRTLQAILEEIHKLRQDLQATSAAAQRGQILLYRVRLQMDTVERVSQRLEQAHRQVTAAKNELNHFLEQKKSVEDRLEQTQDAVRHKELEGELAMVQSMLERIKDNEPDAEAKEAALTNELGTEQSKLGELQNQLERLDKTLASEH